MTKYEVIAYANIIVDVLGRGKKGTKKLPQLDENGLRIGETQSSKMIIERVYSAFGFDISFIEESRSLCAIFFDDQLVFDVTGGAYDNEMYSSNSTVLMKLAEANPQNAEVFLHGVWEQALADLAENADTVKAKIKKRKVETEKTLNWVDEYNDKMLKFIKFKYYSRGFRPPVREYKDKAILIRGSENNQAHLNVWIIKDGKIASKVFDYETSKYVNGPWIQYVDNLCAVEQNKLARIGRQYRINPRTLKDEQPVEEPVNVRKLTVAELLEQIRIFTT